MGIIAERSGLYEEEDFAAELVRRWKLYREKSWMMYRHLKTSPVGFYLRPVLRSHHGRKFMKECIEETGRRLLMIWSVSVLWVLSQQLAHCWFIRTVFSMIDISSLCLHGLVIQRFSGGFR
jgi:biopolymer transport protein ExbB